LRSSNVDIDPVVGEDIRRPHDCVRKSILDAYPENCVAPDLGAADIGSDDVPHNDIVRSSAAEIDANAVIRYEVALSGRARPHLRIASNSVSTSTAESNSRPGEVHNLKPHHNAIARTDAQTCDPVTSHARSIYDDSCIAPIDGNAGHRATDRWQFTQWVNGRRIVWREDGRIERDDIA
jgi:hypothetical protein